MDTLKFVNLAKPPEPLFTPRAAAAQLGLSVKTLMAHRRGWQPEVHQHPNGDPQGAPVHVEKSDDIH
jgi:hypothetical protein